MFSSASKGMFRRPAETANSFNQSPSAASAQPKQLVQSVNISTFRARSHKKEEESRQNNNEEKYGPTVLAIGGGKGGIGKSFISANLSISLAQLGYQVALVDLDLGAANLHTCLGIQSPSQGIIDFVSGRIDSLDEVGVETGIQGLTLFGGGQESWQQVRPHADQKAKLIAGLQELDSDYVILDLGAGTHFNTLDFFVFSHVGLMVVVPEPTSIENAYVFLKSVLFRKMQSLVRMTKTESITNELMEQLADPQVTVPPINVVRQFVEQHSELQPILELVEATDIGFIMNQVRTKADVEVGHSMAHISKGYFGFSAELIGSACHDDTVWKAVRSRQAVTTNYPDSLVAQNIKYIAEQIVNRYQPRMKLKMSS